MRRNGIRMRNDPNLEDIIHVKMVGSVWISLGLQILLSSTKCEFPQHPLNYRTRSLVSSIEGGLVKTSDLAIVVESFSTFITKVGAQSSFDTARGSPEGNKAIRLDRMLRELRCCQICIRGLRDSRYGEEANEADAVNHSIRKARTDRKQFGRLSPFLCPPSFLVFTLRLVCLRLASLRFAVLAFFPLSLPSVDSKLLCIFPSS